jgi:iron complex transport system permease protein
MTNQIKLTKEKLFIYILVLLILLIFVFVLSLSLGTKDFSLIDLIKVLFGRSQDDIRSEIILRLRLPRILTAMLVGASLSIVGAVFQALLKNPLAEPYILGVSSGGALGAIIAISIGVQLTGISLFSFVGSLVTFFFVFLFGRRFGEIDPNTILLVGVMVNAFLSALILFIVSLIDQSFRTALFWLMGNLSLTDYSSISLIAIVFVIASIIFLYFSNQFNLISIDEENAKQFGVKTRLLKNLSFIFGSLLIGVVVANVGIIGFVGLVVPHLCRLIFGYDNRIVMPTSIFVGAIFMMIADLFSRLILSPIEIPIGSITAVIGSPIFIFLLKHKGFSNGG